MQAIARVNRVFKDKPGGLVVDYLGLAHELRRALATYNRERRHRNHRAKPARSRSGHAREVRGLPGSLPRLRPHKMDHGYPGRASRAPANKLLSGEIRTRRRKNVVQARSFEEMLGRSLGRYQNRAIEAAQVIEELIQLAREMREANARGETLGLNEEEVAFYDALEANDSAVQVLGDETLRVIARELVTTVRANVTIDWTMRENVRAHLRVLVKRILRKNGYPPDKQERATRIVLEQAEMLSRDWAVA